ncbi:MAG: NUDIX domain-containing protein [Aquamicrobium sp.]|uniref:NUDIX hydrolase n=1 Tax=Aquamicrobium sp. TaxID=1872579 RepID=UPI00349EB0F7|nr:NUDIX domain-containing protein [Aquamicrobium sp.]
MHTEEAPPTPPAPIRAVSAAIFHEGRFLLVRRGRAPARGLYAFPGGRVEAGETLVEAVRREVMEETGAHIAAIAHIVDLELSAERDERRVEFILSVHSAAFAGGTIVAGDDADMALWVTLDEMAALPLARSVYEIAQRVASA